MGISAQKGRGLLLDAANHTKDVDTYCPVSESARAHRPHGQEDLSPHFLLIAT